MREYWRDSSGAVYDSDSQHPISRYEADSDISTPSREELRGAGRNYPTELSEAYRHVPPDLDARIPQSSGANHELGQE